MPNINQMRESKYLKKEDCGDGILVTITGCVQENVAMEGQPSDLKWCLTFKEVKPCVANSTNLQLCAKALGSDETEAWIGKKVVLYNDPSITFGGKLVGGIRVRAVRGQAARDQAQTQAQAATPAPAPSSTVDDPDEINF